MGGLTRLELARLLLDTGATTQHGYHFATTHILALRKRLERLLTGSEPVFLPLEDLRIKMARTLRFERRTAVLETDILPLKLCPYFGAQGRT